MTPNLLHLQQNFSLGTVLPQSFRRALSSTSCLDFHEVKTELYKSVIKIFWDEVVIVRNAVKKENLDV